MSELYDDIIGLPHPSATRYPRMSAIDRAAQFSPFAAITGHKAAIRETARLTDQKMELDDEMKAGLDSRLRLVVEQQSDSQTVSITYFRPDQKKAGGAYVTVTGFIKRIDELERTVLMHSGEQIPINDIYGIESDILRPLI